MTQDLLGRMDAYWRAANYLSVGQIYLLDNPLLREPLRIEHVKPRLLGHWGTTPGQNFVYVHLNRAIKVFDLDMIYISGPGHGGPALVANTYLEGSYSEVYPSITRDAEGLKRLFRQFSFPGGIPSHVAPETPGSIHEGGELGYSLSHAFGAVFDNPNLIVACVVGDGEAETGPLATAWHSNKFLNPAADGAVLPILHLNGYKIANPTLLARIPRDELQRLLEGCGWQPYFVEGHEPAPMHELMSTTLDRAIAQIHDIQRRARTSGAISRPTWPMIVLSSPKGWTGPARVDGKQVEGTFRSHQVPLSDPAHNPAHLVELERWLRSYRPEELFDDGGALRAELAELAPTGARRMGANPHANGGVLLKDLHIPDFRTHAVAVPAPGQADAEDTRVLGTFLRAVISANQASANFRIFGPDETASNRLDAVFDVTARQWVADILPEDQWLASSGRVMEVLSEHQCQGWLEGYLLTGRHGLFNTYEAFAHIVDSMFNQHAKWLKVARELPWRRPIASLNYLLSSHVWRQDHNGFTHQDPGFIDLALNKKPEVVRVYLPPDANTPVHQHRRRRKAQGAAVARYGCGGQALRGRRRAVAVGGHRRRRRAGCGPGRRRRRADARGAGGGRDPARRAAVTPRPRGQHRRSDAAAAARRASPRAQRRGLRPAVHAGQADHLRVSRLSVAHSPPDLPPHQSPQPSRPRLQGRRHDHDAVRHGSAERSRSFPPGGRRGRSAAAARCALRLSEAAHGGAAHRTPDVHSPLRRRHAVDPRLAVAGDGAAPMMMMRTAALTCARASA
jgi:xylulose-5-phosphate/fructose-6-phosphate phosphoketolase